MLSDFIRLLIAVASSTLVCAQSTTPLTCTANAGVPPLVRAEGFSELAGDLVLTCTGGTADVPFPVQIDLYADTNITSRIVSGFETEALLIVDELQGPHSATYRGNSPDSTNLLRWDIQFVAPGQNAQRRLRFTNLRVNASGYGDPNLTTPRQVITFIGVTPTGALPIDNPVQIVGFVKSGVTAQMQNCSGTGLPDPAKTTGTMPFSLKFTEGFQTALRPKIAANQETGSPGGIFHSESGFIQGPVVGRADSGTRLMAKFQGLPANARVYVTVSENRVSGSASLVQADANGVGSGVPVPSTTTMTCPEAGAAIPAAEIPVTNNSAVAVWEVASSSAYAIDSYVFGFRVDVPGQTGPMLPTVTLGLAPAVMPSPGDQASATLPIPRFSLLLAGGGIVPGRFYAVSPCRLVDTRSATKPAPFGAPTIAGGTTRTIPMTAGGCSLPPAVAYSMNVTALPKFSLGYLTLFPSGGPRPTVSTLNSLDGRVVANAAIVPAGTNSSIDVYATNDTEVIIDVNGYFAAGPASVGSDFVPLTPCRIADSRMPSRPLPFGPPALAASEQRDYPFPLSACGPPADAVAYVTNLTVVPYGYLGYLTVWPSGSQRPSVSTLNSFNGLTTANAAIVKSGVSGAVSAYVTNTTDLIIDTSGAFAPRGGQGNFFAIAPCRAVDTRLPSKGAPVLAGQTERTFSLLQSGCGIQGTPIAYSLNVTVVPEGRLDYLTVWPAGASRPVVSTLNSPAGSILANAAIVPAGTNGGLTVYASNETHVIVDINGYFAH